MKEKDVLAAGGCLGAGLGWVGRRQECGLGLEDIGAKFGCGIAWALDLWVCGLRCVFLGSSPLPCPRKSSNRQPADKHSTLVSGPSVGRKKECESMEKGWIYARCAWQPACPRCKGGFLQMRRPNVWPRGHLTELETAFKVLGQLMIRVGLLLARHCDKYVAAQGLRLPTTLHDVLHQSPCPKVGSQSSIMHCKWGV
jgi:hypothetical protein